MALAQPSTTIKAPAMGAIRNWPKDPPALTMPTAMPRLSGAIRRVVVVQHRRPGDARAAGGQHADGEDQAAVLLISGVMKVPKATSTTPVNSTRP